MQSFMHGLDKVLRRRKWAVLLAWLGVFALALPFAMRQSDHLTGGGFIVPGSQSKRVADAIGRDFPHAEKARLAGLLIAKPGTGAQGMRAAIGSLDAAARKTSHVTLPAGVRDAALAASATRRELIVPLQVSISEDRAQDVAADLREDLGIGKRARGGVEMHLVGQGALWAGLQDVSKKDLADAEKAGFPIVLLILLTVFGSFAAATLPLALGVISVLLTGALIFFLSQAMEMSVFVTNMASMLGIGVAVDYSLFVLSRYREEISAGRSRLDARASAMATSGVAVAFSGATVILSLAGLWMVHNQALRSMALGAMLVVAVSVLASATLLPVLIRFYGTRAYKRTRFFTITNLALRSRARRQPGSTRPGGPGRTSFWERWTALVTRNPVPVVIVVSIVMLTLAVPVLGMKTRVGALDQFTRDNETRIGFEAAARLAGPGAFSPTRVLVRLRHGAATAPANAATLRDLRTALASDPAVRAVGPPQPSRDGREALLIATPRAAGESDQTHEMVRRLRRTLPAAAGARADVLVGGATAGQLDVKDQIASSMWKIILFVLGLSYVVLMILLRSVLLPLKAVLMNLLSVGAAYGVLVAVFQWGWVDGFLGFESPGAIDVLTPPLILAVVFGLSMDYEVFLLSRIRERYEATRDSRLAVAQGLAASARTITSAALIMTAVFAVFVGTGVPSIKELGLGNAVAIALDATLVRLVLVPAAMELLGDWNWWLPGPLRRLLPKTSFEQAPHALAS